MRLLRMTHHHWVVLSAARITKRAVRHPPRTWEDIWRYNDEDGDDEYHREGILRGVLGRFWVLWAPFGAVLGHFDALLERSKTKQKVKRSRHPDFTRMSRAKSLF